MQFQNFDTAAFLRDYWQQKPLLIRSPWRTWANPLAPDELAGLACEEEIESRLIEVARKGWKLEHGPLPEDRFGKLGKKQWTLLVQAVDHHVPAVAQLITPFRFLPNWRIDDVMVSYASDGGGVGPHYDQYDVFLIQGLGRRRWQVGQMCDADTPLLPHDDLRLLADFQPTEEWVLEAGDILYVPPRCAHNGVAVGDDCMTYSVGFRAPSRSELVAGWCQHLAETLVDDDRFADTYLSATTNPGEITEQALSQLHAMVAGALQDRAGFAAWFGEYTTAPKYPEVDWQPEEPFRRADVARRLVAGEPLCRNPASRFAFVRAEGGVSLFVDGECWSCREDAAMLAEAICASETFTLPHALSDEAMKLLITLLDQGSVGFDDGGAEAG